MNIREFRESDLEEMIMIWNDIVEEGIAFPQEDILNLQSGNDFFSSQTYNGVATINERIIGLYILHPNNVGRCSHLLHIPPACLAVAIPDGRDSRHTALRFHPQRL